MLSIAHTKEIWKTAALPFFDLTNLLLAAAAAYYLRYDLLSEFLSSDKLIYGWQYVQWSVVCSIFVIMIYAFLGVYKIFNKLSRSQIFFNLAIGIWLTVLSIITFLYFNEYTKKSFPEGFTISRFVIGTVGFFAMGFVFLGRIIFNLVEQYLYTFNIGKVSVAVIGEKNDSLLEHLSKRENIKKIYSFTTLESNNYQEIREKIENYTISEIYLLSQGKENDNINNLEAELALLAERYKVRFIFSPHGYGYLKAFKLRSIILGNEYFFEMYYSALEGWQVIAKRLFDIGFSLAFMIFFSWAYLIIAILIKLDSQGPIFYASERVGSNGKVFKMYKFRRFKAEFCTSETDPKAKKALEYEQKLIQEQGAAADRGALYKIKSDPRMTKMGKFLEKSSLDEIPQFFNVLIGNLSIVGPRAHQPREVKKYAKSQFKVLNIKPGITGYAQMKGRSDLPFDKEAQLDTWYVENWTFWLDLYIIVQTPIKLIFGKHKS
jgi:exopolysaccharide biosynthesis polyprenyl glycosylphosphotransferase